MGEVPTKPSRGAPLARDVLSSVVTNVAAKIASEVAPHVSDDTLRAEPSCDPPASAPARQPLAPTERYPLFERNRQGVDLGGQDEIVLRQPADGVRPQLDPCVAVAFEMDVGMVAVGLGDLSHAIEKRHAGHKVLHDPILANALAVVRQAPA